MNSAYKKVKKWYNNNVDLYTNKSAVLLYEQLEYFISQMPKNGKILDLGCGPGHDTEYLTKKGFMVTGIDFSSNMIDYAKKNRKVGIFKKIDILKIDKYFKKNYFDGIWSSSSITHFKKNDFIKVFKKIKLIARPQHPIIIIVKRRIKRKQIKRKILFNEFYKKDILNYCKKSGLYVKKIKIFKALNLQWFFIHAEK